MRIGLDARTMFAPQARGTGRNLRDVLRRLSAASPGDTYLLYHRRERCAAHDGDGRDWLRGENVIARRIECLGDRFDAWLHVRLPLSTWLDRLDVLHAPAGAAPAWSPAPLVVTIHDLIPLGSAGDCGPRDAEQFRRVVQRTLRVATHVVTPSAFTRAELVRTFGVAGERISVVPWAPDSELTGNRAAGAPDAQARIRKQFELDRPWILNFSGRTKRKNARALVEAFAALPAKVRNEALLVLTGVEHAPTRSALLDLAQARGVASDCRILGFLSAGDAAALLNGAQGVAIPSLAEGFGLPVLDAMACGVPVLASDCTSLPEVAGDAAIYVDARSIASIRDGLIRLIGGEGREEQIGRGKARAAQFTWDKTAAALQRVYQRAARPKASRVAGTVAEGAA